MNILDEIQVDKEIPVPLYYQVKQAILERINDGTLKVGDLLPAEMEFCSRLDVSRPTIRQAMNELVNYGYLKRMKGKGTFISRPKIDAKFFQKLMSFNDEMLQKGMTPKTKVLELIVMDAIPEINSRLELAEDARLICLARLRFADEEPLVFLETYLPFEIFHEFMNADFVHNSMYEMMETMCGIRVSRVRREIEAVHPTAREAQYLEISRGDAVCLVRTVGYTGDGRPIEYSVARYRGDRTKFDIELYR